MIPYGHQHVDDDDIEAVVKVLRGDWLTQGPAVEDFEQKLAACCEARYAVAFASGTAALHAAAAATGLGTGDLVVTSPLTFAASANAARYVGATVDLRDIDPTTLNIDLAGVGAGVDGLVAVHFAGLPLDLTALAHRPRVVIEDAAHAIGAATPDGPVGNCAHSDATIFSFHPVKTLTTGEGGAATTNDPDLAERLRRFRNHGVVRLPDEGGWAYDVADLGCNYRLSDIHAALGRSQLEKLDTDLAHREVFARRYDSLLSDLAVTTPPAAPAGWVHGRHLYPIRVADRRRVYDELRGAGIGVQVHYRPIHHHSAFADIDPERHRFPHAEAAYRELLSLPLFPDLGFDRQDLVVAALRAALR
ncbi:MAG: DegT/DnrJ/EryC1/StrS family aminotransferase [Acidimicrobiales bacterium]